MEDREFLQGMLEVLVNAIKAHAIVVMESNSQIVAALHDVVDAIEARTAPLDAGGHKEWWPAALGEVPCEHKDTKSVCEDDGAVLFRCAACGMGQNRAGNWVVPPVVWSIANG